MLCLLSQDLLNRDQLHGLHLGRNCLLQVQHTQVLGVWSRREYNSAVSVSL